MESIKEKNLLLRLTLESEKAESNANDLEKSVKGVEGALKKTNEQAKKTTKEAGKDVKGLTSLFEKLPGPIGEAAKRINEYAKNLLESKKAADAAAVGTKGLTRAVKLLGIAFKSSGILLIVTILAGIASGLSRTQNIVDSLSGNVSALGNVFEKFADNLIEGRNPFENLQQVFKETLALEQLSNQLRDKRVQFIEREAKLESEIADLRLSAEDASLNSFQRLIKEQEIVAANSKLVEERVAFLNEEIAIEEQKIALTNNLIKDEEALANLRANLIRTQSEGELATIRNQRRIATLQKQISKELEDAQKSAKEILSSFTDLGRTETEILSKNLLKTLDDFKEILASADQLENQLRVINGQLPFDLTIDTSVDELTDIISQLIQQAELEAEKSRSELGQEITEARISNDLRNERRRQLAILDSQIAFVQEQIRLEEELQKVRQLNTDEDIARFELLKEQLRGLTIEREQQGLSVFELIFGPNYTQDDFLKDIFTIIDGFSAVTAERLKASNDAVAQQEKIVDRLIRLSEFGADEQVKTEIDRLNRLQSEREKAVRVQQQLAAIEIAINQAIATSEILKNIASQTNPLAITLQVAALIAGLAAGGIAIKNAFTDIPAFYEGTEDTGQGGAVDNKGGFRAILHPNERVVPDKYNKALRGIKNYELPKAAETYKSMPAVLSYINKMDTQFSKGMSELKNEIGEVNQNLKQMKIGLSLDKKGLSTYILGSGVNQKLKRS
jgi:hypothetical protein